MQPGTLRVHNADAERPLRHSHAERGNDQMKRLQVQRVAEGSQRRFLYRFAECRMRVDGAGNVFQPGAHFQALAERRRQFRHAHTCLLYTSPSPRDRQKSRMPSSA